ncbi:MAG: 2-amino-4-hydroxy-6-hydroxymethyldihydropteridine diphosphokinase [bacterium]
MTTKKVFVSLGSNLGDKKSNIYSAIDHISQLAGVKILGKSTLMRTSPIGVQGQEEYLNQVILISTDIPPLSLLSEFKKIEQLLGRKKRAKWAEREIDIDIVVYEGVEMRTSDLNIPHIELPNRLFLLKGCTELGPDYVVEGHGITMKELYFNNIDRLKDQAVYSVLTS